MELSSTGPWSFLRIVPSVRAVRKIFGARGKFLCVIVVEEMKKDFSEPKACGMLSRVCGLALGVWSLGMLGTCIDAPAAMRFGETTFSGFIMEVGSSDILGLRSEAKQALPLLDREL